MEWPTIANEKGPAHLARVGGAAEQLHRDERLAGARGQREQGPLGLALFLGLGHFFEGRADSGVLVVPPLGLAARVRRDERLGDVVGQREADIGVRSAPAAHRRWETPTSAAARWSAR